jgi:pimeloyl-ACP methyl ester carboxylesterase
MASDPIHAAISGDGTEIAGRVRGKGQPLVLVHGGLGDGDASWLLMLPHLAEHFTCFLMSTRGRGLSGESGDHSQERLFEDVAAYIQSIGEPVCVFGHSSGAFWSLGGAAAVAQRVRALAVYEPPFPRLEPPTTDDQYARITAAVADSRLADGVLIATAEIIGLSLDEQALFSQPGVAERARKALPVAVREIPELNRPLQASTAALTMPVLVLHGQHSRPGFTSAARDLVGQLSNARLVEVAGAAHLGPLTAPQHVAEELISFFGGR